MKYTNKSADLVFDRFRFQFHIFMLTAHSALITMAHLRSFGVRFGVVVMISHHGFHIRTHVHYLLLTHLFISYSLSCCHKLDSSTKYSLERGNVSGILAFSIMRYMEGKRFCNSCLPYLYNCNHVMK